MPSRIKRPPRPKPAVQSAIPPHVWVTEGRRRRKPAAGYTPPGLSPLRHSFTAEDLLPEAAEGASYPRYSNPYNNENCHYHYLFPHGSPYASWNPGLGNHFWGQAVQDVGKYRGSRYHYLFPPGSPYESWNPKTSVHSWNLGPYDARLGGVAGKAVVRRGVAKNNRRLVRSPMFSFSFTPSFAVPMSSDSSPSPEHHLDTVPAIQTAIPDVPVTVLRPVFNPDPATNARLPNPGTARATTAPSAECPLGTAPGWAAAHAHASVLQQHCAFFDGDGDGVVTPVDTFRGLRALGLGLPACALATLVTHALFSWPTCEGRMPDPRGRIWLERVHRCRHGSDSGVFDGEGRFVPQKFEDFFAKYGQKEGIHSNRLWEAVRAQRVLLDPVGWLASAMAWFLTYLILQPDSSGFIKKEDIRRVFDGSIFEEIVRRRAEKAGQSERGREGDKSQADAGGRPGKKGGKQKED